MEKLLTEWDAGKLERGDLSKAITNLHLMAFEATDRGKGLPPCNHWCLFLETNDKKSVRLDMNPGYGTDGQQGKIQISSKPYPCSQNHLVKVSLPLASGVTVQKAVQALAKKGRQTFRFTNDLQGCRHWCDAVLQDLETAGYAARGSTSHARSAMAYFYESPTQKELRQARQGSLHLPKTEEDDMLQVMLQEARASGAL